MKKYDFSGWATKTNIRCSDGRTIMPNAFKDNDGTKVPLVWNHQHNDSSNVLGHAYLEHRPEGMYTYGTFNDTEQGRNARLLVEHGDVVSLSIYANKLKQRQGNVMHGAIREVSLVLAGANPGAFIDSVTLSHSEEASIDDADATIYSGEKLSLTHAEDTEESEEKKEEKEEKKVANEKTVKDVFDELTEEQKTVVYALIGQALDTEDDGGDDVKHNIFEQDEYGYEDDSFLSHAETEAIFSDVRRYGSLRDTVLQHGIENVEYLFPDAQNVTDTPGWIKRDTDWVSAVMGGATKRPFSRIKSMFADLTEDEARAKGYIKGKKKKEEVFGLLKRTTSPTTVYKKQKMDRDDVIDIDSFDVVAWLKTEMRMMLDEEIARAILIGDGRPSSSDDKINEQNIRPIMKDDDLYTIHQKVVVPAGSSSDSTAKEFISQAVRARKDYKGSGNPTLFTTEAMLTECLLIEDRNGRRIYESEATLATSMRVSKIVTVPVMENINVNDDGDELLGIIVNLSDYSIGADKGGAVNMFDDFDIDYNAQKYLIETRCSGALTQPYSAIVLSTSTPADSVVDEGGE